MKKYFAPRSIVPLAAIVMSVIASIGCSSDVDPDKVKVNDPGYYNGPMHKGGKGADGATTDTKK